MPCYAALWPHARAHKLCLPPPRSIEMPGSIEVWVRPGIVSSVSPRLRPLWGMNDEELESYRRISRALKGDPS